MFLTVAILSYNRPAELLRSLQSLIPLPDDVEVIVFDDFSPLLAEVICSFKKISATNINIKISINNENLGYDANLLNSVLKASGDYVLLLSDDDYLEYGALQSILSNLRRCVHPLSFVRFCEKSSNDSWIPPPLGRGRRDFGKKNYFFDSSELFKDGSFIYHSILFSGLIFQKSEVMHIKKTLSSFEKSIYIQVAIFALLANKFGAQFISGPGVVACSDGDNGFGKNPASISEMDLIDRSNIHSNLKFNMRLIKVIHEISNQIGPSFEVKFFSEFNYRNFSGMRYARMMGRSSLVSYWNDLGKITKHRNLLHYFIFYLMWLLPCSIVSSLSILFFKLSHLIRPGR